MAAKPARSAGGDRGLETALQHRKTAQPTGLSQPTGVCQPRKSLTLSGPKQVIRSQGLSKLLGIGVVESEYQYDPERSEYHSVRRVRWAKIGPWDTPEDARLPMKTLTDVSNYQTFLNFALPLFEEANIDEPPPIAPPRSVYTVDDALTGLFMTKGEFTSILEALGRKKNVILQGPPGVGKTFVARRLAYAIIGSQITF